jgi:glycosyltransferase involved in cell wall biosynthesis
VRRARIVVVPSDALAIELQTEHAVDIDRIRVIPNPVAVASFARPPDFAREEARSTLGVRTSDLLVAFVALGHFERKGLPHLLSALTMTTATVRLVVVGGQADVIRSYRNRVARLGLGDRVKFVGHQRDVRPFLWSADAFAAPSAYESFSLATFQAAAAGLPLVVTPLTAVAPVFEDGRNGIAVERDAADIARALARLAASEPAWRLELGAEARRAAARFDVPRFAEHWRNLYGELAVLRVTTGR